MPSKESLPVHECNIGFFLAFIVCIQAVFKLQVKETRRIPTDGRSLKAKNKIKLLFISNKPGICRAIHIIVEYI